MDSSGRQCRQWRCLLVDNYDSYTHNLFHLIASVTQNEPIVIRNNDDSLYHSLRSSNAFDIIVLSPGPGRPERAVDFGICKEILEAADRPVLGVCLGCQGLGWVYGLPVNLNPDGPAHGCMAAVFHNEHTLFRNLPQAFSAVRYHSLSLCTPEGSEPQFPDHLEKLAWTEDGIVMAIGHKYRPLWGVQFHPESICSEHGLSLVRNFISLSCSWYEKQDGVLLATYKHELLERNPFPIQCAPNHSVAEIHAKVEFGSRCRRNIAVRFRKLDCSPDAETVFFALLHDDPHSFWLDSARNPHPSSKFSYMGPSNGPLCSHVRYTVSSRSLVVSGNGSTQSTLTDIDLFDYLKAQLQDLHCECPELPLDFIGGYVGYFGYELKCLCEDGLNLPNKFQSPHPDSQLLFADRIIAFDHCNGGVFLVSLVDTACWHTMNEAEVWFNRTSVQLKQLANKNKNFAGSSSSSSFSHRSCHGVERDCDLENGVGGAEEDRAALDESPCGPGTVSMAPEAPCAPSDSCLPEIPPMGVLFSAVDVALPVAEEEEVKDVFRLLSRAESCHKHVSAIFVANETVEGYRSKISQCQEWIKQGEAYEICLTTRLHANQGFDEVSSLSFYRRLRNMNPAPFAALIRCGTDLTICSSSPERYLRVKRDTHTGMTMVESRPIKGTRPRGKTAEEDSSLILELMKSGKDRQENLMIVDLVRNDLGRVCCPGSVTVPDLFKIESYSSVHQMVSSVQGQLKQGLGAVDAMRASFPMGSMTGAPKPRVLSLIDAIEEDARGVYSGCIGFLGVDGEADLSVAIRLAVLDGREGRIGAGGAIIALSDADDEWRELQLKAASVTQAAS